MVERGFLRISSYGSGKPQSLSSLGWTWRRLAGGVGVPLPFLSLAPAFLQPHSMRAPSSLTGLNPHPSIEGPDS